MSRCGLMNADLSQQSSFRVLVIFGGGSAERAVSLESGRAVADALNAAGHTVGTWDPEETPVTELKALEWDIAFPMLHGTGGDLHQIVEGSELCFRHV